MTSINRRTALGGIAAGSVVSEELLAETARQAARRNSRQQTCCPKETPGFDEIQELREMFEEFQRNQPKKRATLAAFAAAYMDSLWEGETPTDHPYDVAGNILEFISSLTPLLQTGLGLGLAWINLRSRKRTGKWFTELTYAERRQLLNQGEEPEAGCTISWDRRYVAHTIVESLAMVTRLVTNSRNPARLHINGMWGPEAKKKSNLADDPLLDRPDYPEWDDESDEFDVVVIGSGAGGAVVASEVLKAGHRCLIIESGDWIHPTQYVQHGYEGGKEVVYPPKAEEVLRKAYMRSGLIPVGKLLDVMSPNELLESLASALNLEDDDPNAVIDTKKPALINMVQANVVGGGPYINNAIHLPIKEKVWNDWAAQLPDGKPLYAYSQLCKQMCAIEEKLGVSKVPTSECIGGDAHVFMQGVDAIKMESEPLPVSIADPEVKRGEAGASECCYEDERLDEPVPGSVCIGGGSDNWIDPHGRHIGGLHPYRTDKPNSYLMDIVKHCADSKTNCIAYKTRAVRFEVDVSPDGKKRDVTHLVIEDGHGARLKRRKVRAKKFVLAAGTFASTQVLMATPLLNRLHGLGTRLNGNVGSPLTAIFGKPVRDDRNDSVFPGIAQCVMVDEAKVKVPGSEMELPTPILENWFGLPGMVALSAGGWFGESAKVMNNFRNLAICGAVIPTANRDENKIDSQGRPNLDLSKDEFELYLRGLRLIGEIFLAAAKVREDTVELIFPTKAMMLNEDGTPLRVTDKGSLDKAIAYIGAKGRRVPFLNIITSHPQGGNSLGVVVDADTFKVKTTDNLYVADASIFPGPCKINPQLTLKALAHTAAEKLLEELAAQKNG